MAEHTNIMYVNGTTTGISSKQKKEVKDRRSLSKKNLVCNSVHFLNSKIDRD